VGRSRDRWDDAVRRGAVDLLRIGEVEGDSTKQKVGVFGVRGGPARPENVGWLQGRRRRRRSQFLSLYGVRDA
jgi:hypothetical protein